MNFVFPALVGLLFAGAVYMMLRDSMFERVIGLAMLAHATNLLIFVAAGTQRGYPPLVAEGETVLDPLSADPLPQALILTAIVIGFGITAFTLAVARRVISEGETSS